MAVGKICCYSVRPDCLKFDNSTFPGCCGGAVILRRSIRVKSRQGGFCTYHDAGNRYEPLDLDQEVESHFSVDSGKKTYLFASNQSGIPL
jgi:hypothetical protein